MLAVGHACCAALDVEGAMGVNCIAGDDYNDEIAEDGLTRARASIAEASFAAYDFEVCHCRCRWPAVLEAEVRLSSDLLARLSMVIGWADNTRSTRGLANSAGGDCVGDRSADQSVGEVGAVVADRGGCSSLAADMNCYNQVVCLQLYFRKVNLKLERALKRLAAELHYLSYDNLAARPGLVV